MAITAAMVKDLREKTGAGMMDCKKALTAVDGDVAKAIDYLREKGIAKAEKKLAASPQRALLRLMLARTRKSVRWLRSTVKQTLQLAMTSSER